ncbi:MAG: hypothetical protein FOGNACKC_00903 [Anaerolineae bacterium]|nr:hypothetical protein [Anaerolineae bacterium]
MAFWDRWVDGYLNSRGYVKADDVPRVSFETIFSGESDSSDGRGLLQTLSDEKARQLAMQSAWVYSNTDLISGEFSQGEVLVHEEKDGKDVELPDHELNAVFKTPSQNEFLDASFLWGYTVTWALLRGEAYWLMNLNRTGKVAEILPVPSDRMAPIADRKNYIKEFRYYPDDNPRGVPIPKERVMYWRRVNINSYRRGFGLFTPLDRPMQAEDQATRWNLDTFSKGLTLQTLLLLPADLREDIFETARAQIEQQLVREKKRFMVARGGQVDAKTIGMTHSDAQFMALRNMARDEIDRIFNIPEGFWSAKANRATAQAARANFMDFAVWPLMVSLGRAISGQIVWRYYDKNLKAKFRDTRPTDRAMELTERRFYWSIYTLDECRKEIGMKPIGGELGKMLYPHAQRFNPQQQGGGEGGGKGQPKLPGGAAPQLPGPGGGGDESGGKPPTPPGAAYQEQQGKPIDSPLGDEVIDQTPAAAVAAKSVWPSRQYTNNKDEAIADLRRWRARAVKMWQRGDDPATYDFYSQHIPGYLVDEIKAGLETVAMLDEVHKLFGGAEAYLRGKKALALLPRGGGEALPDLLTVADLTDADFVRVVKIWDELMPEWAGLLGAPEEAAESVEVDTAKAFETHRYVLVGDIKAAPIWEWNTKLRRYRNTKTKKIIGAAQMVELRDTFIERQQQRVADLAGRLVREEITVQEWALAQREIIKETYLAQYGMAVGGRQKMLPRDYGRIGAELRGQYKYLSDFAEEIRSGAFAAATPDGLSNRIAHRANLYIGSSVRSFEKGRVATYGDELYDALPQVPGDGETACMTQCRCSLRIEETGTEYHVFWVLDKNAEHCDDCERLSKEWKPYIVPKIIEGKAVVKANPYHDPKTGKFAGKQGGKRYTLAGGDKQPKAHYVSNPTSLQKIYEESQANQRRAVDEYNKRLKNGELPAVVKPLVYEPAEARIPGFMDPRTGDLIVSTRGGAHRDIISEMMPGKSSYERGEFEDKVTRFGFQFDSKGKLENIHLVQGASGIDLDDPKFEDKSWKRINKALQKLAATMKDIPADVPVLVETMDMPPKTVRTSLKSFWPGTEVKAIRWHDPKTGKFVPVGRGVPYRHRGGKKWPEMKSGAKAADIMGYCKMVNTELERYREQEDRLINDTISAAMEGIITDDKTREQLEQIHYEYGKMEDDAQNKIWRGMHKKSNVLDLTVVMQGSVAEWQDEAMTEFLARVQRRPELLARAVTVDVRGNRRASFNSAMNRVDMAEGDGSYVVMHEMGHWLEHHDRKVYKAAKAFLDKRTAGEREKPMSMLTGNPTYNDWEYGRKDKFRTPYVGKSYDNATEVISMGVQYLWQDPLKFAKEDPEHMELTLKALEGSL